MLTVIAIILWCIAAVLMVLTTVMLTPVPIKVKLRKDTGCHAAAALCLFGRVGPWIPHSTSKRGRGTLKEKVKSHARRRKQTRKMPSMLRARSRLLKDILHQVRVRRLSFEPVCREAVLTGRAERVLSLPPAALLRPAIWSGWQTFGPVR